MYEEQNQVVVGDYCGDGPYDPKVVGVDFAEGDHRSPILASDAQIRMPTLSEHVYLNAGAPFEQPSLSELMIQRAQLNAEIAERQKAEKATVIASIRALMRDYGVTLSDLGGAAKRHALAGIKVAAKYRDPETGRTWSGRGRPPFWIAGKDFEAFRIAA